MTNRTPDRLPVQDQPALFPLADTCTVPGCQAGTRKNLCAHDADVAHGLTEPHAQRPVACLNTHPQPDANIPY